MSHVHIKFEPGHFYSFREKPNVKLCVVTGSHVHIKFEPGHFYSFREKPNVKLCVAEQKRLVISLVFLITFVKGYRCKYFDVKNNPTKFQSHPMNFVKDIKCLIFPLTLTCDLEKGQRSTKPSLKCRGHWRSRLNKI